VSLTLSTITTTANQQTEFVMRFSNEYYYKRCYNDEDDDDDDDSNSRPIVCYISFKQSLNQSISLSRNATALVFSKYV